ncbi:MAG: ATP-binding protein, partial [Chloroflexi bacterium]|nr:ATP-binding protein [Chloroflexota bacterium]
AVARFTDRGVAFEGALSVPYIEPLERGMLPEGGYGLRLARAALDRLEYRRTNAQINLWRLVKRLS